MLLFARGTKNAKSKTMAGTQLFSYSEFTLYEGKGFYSVTQADVIESFYGISLDIESLAYGAYISELSERASFEELKNEGIFELLMRTLLMISKGSLNPRLVTAVFIIRLVKESGFIGELGSCQRCGREFVNEAYLSDRSSELICGECQEGNEQYLCSGALKAVNYISDCSLNILYKFNVSDEVLEQVWLFADVLRREYLEERYKTLDYINNMKFSY